MANVENDWEKAAENMSGWCAGCGTRLEKETPKTFSVYVSKDNTTKAIYLICDPCCDIVVSHSEGYEEILKRIEERAALHSAVGNAQGEA
jgi:predicted RNase H-like HicB family nuclease